MLLRLLVFIVCFFLLFWILLWTFNFCFESAFVLLFNKFLEIFLFIFCCLNVCVIFLLFKCFIWSSVCCGTFAIACFACFHCFWFLFYLFISNACLLAFFLFSCRCVCVYVFIFLPFLLLCSSCFAGDGGGFWKTLSTKNVCIRKIGNHTGPLHWLACNRGRKGAKLISVQITNG